MVGGTNSGRLKDAPHSVSPRVLGEYSTYVILRDFLPANDMERSANLGKPAFTRRRRPNRQSPADVDPTADFDLNATHSTYENDDLFPEAFLHQHVFARKALWPGNAADPINHILD